MKLGIIILVVAGCINSALCKFGFGACRTDSGLTFDQYSAALTTIQTTRKPYAHNIMAMDEGFFDLLEALQAWGFKPYFDFRCDRLAKVAPWKAISDRQVAAANTASTG